MRAAARAASRQLAVVFQQRTGTAAAHVKRLLAAGRARPARSSRSARRCGSGMPSTSPCRGAASGRPRAAARRSATASISSTCSRSSSATGRASRRGCGGSIARPRPRTPRPRPSCSTAASSRRSSRARCRRGRRARSASTRRRRRSRSTTCTGTATRTGRSRPAPHVSEDEAAGWALPETEERSDHAPLLRDVFDALLAGEPLPQTADAPARSLELVAAIYASAAADGAVDHARGPRRAPHAPSADSRAR